MVHLWIVYCRSVLEQSCVLWHSTLTQQNIDDLERTQKIFAKLVLQNRYENYEKALLKLDLISLNDRQKKLNLQWAKKGIKYNTLTDLSYINLSSVCVFVCCYRKCYRVTHLNISAK